MGSQILEFIKEILSSLLANGVDNKIGAEISVPIDKPKETPTTGIDWTDPEAKISKYFTVKEACWLPSWQIMHTPSETEKINILKQAEKMDLIREYLGAPINVHCWIRPILNNPKSIHHGQDYNALVKGAKNSAHKIGSATDYNAQGLNCDDARAKLESKLDEWDIRMERMPGGNWVHNDCAPVIGHRYFIP